MGKSAEPESSSSMQPTVCLGFETAALYWRAVREGRLPFPTPFDQQTIPATCVAGYRTLSQVDLSSLGVYLRHDGLVARHHLVRAPSPKGQAGTRQQERIIPKGIALGFGAAVPLHVLVSDQRRRTPSTSIRPHLTSRQLPPHSLYAVTEHVLVTSPELTVVQLMRSIRSLPILELVCEWCGSYAFGPPTSECLYDRMPITDLGRLGDYVSHPHAPRGSGTLRGILPLATGRLASPRETEVLLMLTLPAELGGLALPMPFVNQQIPLKSTPFAKLSDHPYFTVDFLWPLSKVVVEYDGLDDHEKTARQIADDKERRSVLAAMGYLVIVVTRRDLTSLAAFERKALQVACHEHLALPPVDERVLKARTSLFAWLFDPVHDHAPLGFGYA